MNRLLPFAGPAWCSPPRKKPLNFPGKSRISRCAARTRDLASLLVEASRDGPPVLGAAPIIATCASALLNRERFQQPVAPSSLLLQHSLQKIHAPAPIPAARADY